MQGTPGAKPGSRKDSGQRATAPHEQANETITVVLADEHGLFRELLSRVLEMERGIRITGEATTGLDAVAKVRRLKPQAVLTEINMPIIDGLAAMRQITGEFPHIAC
jgi:DNA-binding NarL/FixJ family response regulator